MNTIGKKKVFTSYQAEKFLEKFVPVSENQIVKNIEQITIKPPLVLKIISPDALHKTDIGGVKIVKSNSDLEKSFSELISLSKGKNLKLEGIMVQKFYEGEQLIIGIKKDPTFNHVILFGLGGIFTEVLEDTSIRKCPISTNDAIEMIEELRASKIFHGFRGKKLNVQALVQILVNMSQIPKKFSNIEELDINPLILNEKEGIVVDARIVFNK